MKEVNINETEFEKSKDLRCNIVTMSSMVHGSAFTVMYLTKCSIILELKFPISNKIKSTMKL